MLQALLALMIFNDHEYRERDYFWKVVSLRTKSRKICNILALYIPFVVYLH